MNDESTSTMAFDRVGVSMMKSDDNVVKPTTVSAKVANADVPPNPLKFPLEALEPLLAWYIRCWFEGFEAEGNANKDTSAARHRNERDPLLIQAVKNGDEASVFMFLLPEFSSIVPNEKQVDRSGYTPLHWSAQMGDKTITQLLLDNGSGSSDNTIHSVHAKSKYGRTPLHLAARDGHKDIIETLLAADADVNVKDIDGHTALIESIKSGCIDNVQLLIDNGADTSFTDRYNQTPLFIATDRGEESIVRLLLELGSQEQQKQQKEDETTTKATTSCTRDEVDIIINIKDTMNGQTPLHVAASHGYTSLVKLLCKNGANHKLADKYGVTPIQVAKARDYRSIVHILQYQK